MDEQVVSSVREKKSHRTEVTSERYENVKGFEKMKRNGQRCERKISKGSFTN